MNKFTYLLLLLFCMMGGVMNAQEIIGFTKAAETKTLPANLTTGYYLIKEVNPKAEGKPGGYLKAASEAANAIVTPQGKNTAYDGSNALELWYVEVNGETFTIATANKMAAWQAPYQHQKNLVAYASKGVLTKTTEQISLGNHTAQAQEGSCIIQNEAKSACFHYSSNNLGSWTDANPASVMMFEFYKVEETDLNKASQATVTYTYHLEGTQTTIVKEVQQVIGRNYNAPALDFVTFTQPEGTVHEGTNDVTVNCTENLPFTKTTDLSQPKWFNIGIHASYNYNRIWQYVSDNTDIEVKEKTLDYNLLRDESLLWLITGNVFDGFEIYNKKAGTQNSLNTTEGNAQITEGSHTKWFLKQSRTNAGEPCFTADHSNYLNEQDVLAKWGDADQGSTCRIFAPADWVLTKAENIVNIPTGAVGGYTNDEVIDTPLSVYEKDLFNIENAIALGEALATLQSNGVELTVGGYYRIVSAYPNYKKQQHVQKCMLSLADNEYIKWGNLDLKDINNVFQLDKKSNDKYCLKNANRNAYMQGVKGLLGNNKENAADMDFVELGEAQYNIHYSNGNCHTEGHSGGAGHNGSLVAWDGGQNTASAWYIVKADTVEVALNTAGDASYATTYLPFSVSNVEGATAYIGKVVKQDNKNILHATAIKGGIPANQGVILKGAANAEKAVLTLGKATSDVQNNALIGTLVEKDYTNELVFGVNNNVVGFYSMATGKKIGANKAYLEAAAARAMKLVFDGDVTGIENVMGEAADANAPIYDLTGRRVMKAVKGGLYIQNGKKFIAQ